MLVVEFYEVLDALKFRVRFRRRENQAKQVNGGRGVDGILKVDELAVLEVAIGVVLEKNVCDPRVAVIHAAELVWFHRHRPYQLVEDEVAPVSLLK